MRYLCSVLAGLAFGLIYYPSPWGILVAAAVSVGISRLFTLGFLSAHRGLLLPPLL
jgi:hypothetical protein